MFASILTDVQPEVVHPAGQGQARRCGKYITILKNYLHFFVTGFRSQQYFESSNFRHRFWGIFFAE